MVPRGNCPAGDFSTLPLAQTLSGVLGEKGFGVIPFILGMGLVLVTIITNGLSERPAARAIVVASGVLAVYLLVFVRIAIPTERSHLIEYGVLAVFILAALRERSARGRTVFFPPFLAALFASGIGFLDECLQRVVPGRVFDWEDVLFNVLASVMAIAASEVLRWARMIGGESRARDSHP